MPDTYFTKSPHWEWLIIWYFFFGGIAGGSYFLAALLDLWGDQDDRPVARLGYYVAFVGVALSGALLTIDLNRPERFWHMLLMSERWRPILKYWSPMSIGSWALLLFGGCAFLSALTAFGEERGVGGNWFRLLQNRLVKFPLAVIGGLFGFFVAGYTGVLLTVTNRPLWADTNLLGLLFLLSGASTAAAVLLLLGRWRGAALSTTRWLTWLDSRTLLLEFLVLLTLVLLLGSSVQVWLNVWGVILVLGVVLNGMLLPLTLHARPQIFGALSAPAGAVLVLIGGFLLRMVVVLSAQYV